MSLYHGALHLLPPSSPRAMDIATLFRDDALRIADKFAAVLKDKSAATVSLQLTSVSSPGWYDVHLLPSEDGISVVLHKRQEEPLTSPFRSPDETTES